MAQDLPWKKITAALTGLLFTLLVIYLLDILPNKWSGTIMAAYVFVASAIILGDLKRSLFFLLIVGIPLNLELMVASARSKYIFLSMVDISIVGLIFLWVIRAKSNDAGNRGIDRYPQLTKPGLFFLGANILSLLVSDDKTWCVYGIINAIKLFGVFFVVANSIKTQREIKYVMAFLLISFFLQSAIYIVQHFTGMDFNVIGQSQLSGRFYGATRERGLMGQANTSGLFFAACLLLGMSWYFIERRTAFRALIAVTIGLGLWALIITLTRSAWVSFLVSSMMFIVIGIKRRWLKFRIAIPIFTIAVIIIFSFWDSIMGRVEKDDAGSTQSRIVSIMLMTRIIRDHPFLGVGVNNYTDARNEYVNEDLSEALRHPHNQYLLVFVETGIVGFLSFIWFFYEIFKNGVKSIGSKEPSKSKLAAGVLMSLFAICVGMLGIGNAGAVANLTWFLTGFMPAVGGVLKENPLQN